MGKKKKDKKDKKGKEEVSSRPRRGRSSTGPWAGIRAGDGPVVRPGYGPAGANRRGSSSRAPARRSSSAAPEPERWRSSACWNSPSNAA